MRTWLAGFIVFAGSVTVVGTASSQPPANDSTHAMARVRSRDTAISGLIARAAQQSPAFQRLVDAINASDGIIYIEPGTCRHGVRACLVAVTSTGDRRFIFVKVDVRRAQRDLMASIGHELQHAIEVLGDPNVKDFRSLYFFLQGFRSARNVHGV